MREAERIAGSQQVRACELVGRRQRRDGGQAGQLRRQVQGSVVLEHGHTACQCLRVGRQRGKPPQHRARERTGSHLGRRGERRGIAGVLDRGEQLAHLQRIARGQLEAAPAELVVGAGKAPSHELGDRRRAERRQRADPRGGLARQLQEESPLTELARARPDHDADRLVGQASGQIHEEAQGGLVRPVGVIDHEQQRLSLREPQHEPVEGVQDREGRFGDTFARTVLTLVEQHARLPCRAGQQLVAVRPEGRLEQRPRDAPSERPLQLVAARVQDGDTSPARQARRALEQRRLPDPRRPFDQRERAVPGGRVLQQLLQQRKLGVTLQQRLGRRRSATGLQVGRHPASIPRTDRVVDPKRRQRSPATPDYSSSRITARSSSASTRRCAPSRAVTASNDVASSSTIGHSMP